MTNNVASKLHYRDPNRSHPVPPCGRRESVSTSDLSRVTCGKCLQILEQKYHVTVALPTAQPQGPEMNNPQPLEQPQAHHQDSHHDNHPLDVGVHGDQVEAHAHHNQHDDEGE